MKKQYIKISSKIFFQHSLEAAWHIRSSLLPAGERSCRPQKRLCTVFCKTLCWMKPSSLQQTARSLKLLLQIRMYMARKTWAWLVKSVWKQVGAFSRRKLNPLQYERACSRSRSESCLSIRLHPGAGSHQPKKAEASEVHREVKRISYCIKRHRDTSSSFQKDLNPCFPVPVPVVATSCW